MSRYPGTVRRGAGWSYYIYVDGKKKWFSGFATQREAANAKRNAELLKRRGALVDRSRITFADYVSESWLPSLSAELKVSTVAQYREKVQYAVTALGTQPIQDIRPIDIEGLRNSLLARGLRPRTVTLAIVTTSLVFKHARDIGGILYDNPCDRVKKPRVERPSRSVLSAEQLKSIGELARGSHWEAFIRLAIYTGARRGEILALTWSDLDLDKGTVRIARNAVSVEGKRVLQSTKSDRVRVVEIDEETCAILRRCKATQSAARLRYGPYWQETDLVVANPDGSAPQPKSATQAWSRLLKKAGIEGFRLHDARHAHTTHLLAQKVPLHVVADRLGHKDSMVTSTVYSHVLDSQRVGAAEAFAAVLRNAR